MAGIGGNYTGVLDQLRAQAQAQGLYEPLAEDGAYYAYLSKVDQVEKGWDALFELINRKLLDLVLFDRPTYVPGSPLPPMPILIFDVAEADEKTLLSTLQVPTSDDLAEGSWFELELQVGPSPGGIEGDLYDAGIDLPESA